MKKNWFFESLYPDIKLGLKVKRNLFDSRSKFQKIKFMDTYRFGKTLVLDGIIQTTTRDEFIYHEMITHIPLFSHPEPENILIIGGGDGGVLREVLKHKAIQKVTLVEIDKKVIEYSKKYLPEICQDSFKNKKLDLVIEDGGKFVKADNRKYEIAIIDSSDPVGPARVLFQDNFYKNLAKLLTKNGIMVRQSGSTFLQEEELKSNYRKLKKIYKFVSIYIAPIPTYIGGMFSFIFCSEKINPEKFTLKQIEDRYAQIKPKTKYYNPEIHITSFKLPNYIKKLIGEEK